MEEMSLIIAVGVPYQVEITSTGIPMHETDVEFCVMQSDVRYSFPAKMVNDNVFIFTITNALSKLLNKTLDYKLYVHYGNARFEADKGSFNLVDKKTFDVKMKKDTTQEVKENKESTPLSERLHAKTKKRPSTKSNVKPTPMVTATKERVVESDVEATKPTPTPEVTPTTTLADAKDAIKKSSAVPKEETHDYNEKIKNILSGLSKTATPTTEIEPTATPVKKEKKSPSPKTVPKGGAFFEEVEHLRQINEKRRKEKNIKNIIRGPDDEDSKE